MTAPRLALSFPDKHRAWHDLVLAAERADGRVLVATEEPLAKGVAVELAIQIGDGDAWAVPAVVEKVRRPSPRFGRAAVVRLADDEHAALRARLAAAPGDAAGSAGRTSPRFDLAWPVAFRTPALFEPVATKDLSAEGMHVHVPVRVTAGDVVELVLFTPQGHELLLAGEVQWASEVTPAVGIRFLFRDDEERELLRGLLLHAVDSAVTRVPSDTVLVVADELSARDAIGAVLSSAPSEVRFVAHVADALALTRIERPRVVIIDAGSPDRVAFCRAVADDAELIGVRLVLYGRDESDLDRVARKAGAHVALPIPATEDRLATVFAGIIPRGR
jgi:CheY-like chemotaxis protein